MNYYDSLYGKPTSAVVMDKKSSSSTGEKVYVITCHDADGSLLELLQAVRDFGNCGHSFEIVVDPDAGNKKKSIFWDGDGSDRIDSITSTSAELDLRKVLLANINTIKWIVRGAIPDKNYPDDKPDDPIEALKKIGCTCDTLLDGNGIDFGYGVKEMLDSLIKNANDYIKNCDNPPSEKWTPKEDFEHLLWCLKHYYERMVESQKNDELDEGKPSNTSDGTVLDSTDEQTDEEKPMTEDGFFGLFNRSAAAKKGWETRKQNGWTPGVWPKKDSVGASSVTKSSNPWAKKEQAQKESATQKADALSVLPAHLTRPKAIRNEIDANREMAAGASK